MESSRKDFRAHTVAQPLKREIDSTLMQVQLQKRNYIALEREQAHLRNLLARKKQEVNDLKCKEPQNLTATHRTIQTGIAINNTDRTHQSVVGDIQQIKLLIDVHRKQLSKFQALNTKILGEVNASAVEKKRLQEQIQLRQESIGDLKEELSRFRQLNLRNDMQFQSSHRNVSKQNSKDMNERRKFTATQKSFLAEEHRQRTKGVSESQRPGFVHEGTETLTDALPLTRERIRTIITENKEKLKIAENYRKFGDNLTYMFEVMKEYKGRDDMEFIAQEFVIKEKQLQQIEEYIGKLEGRIAASKTLLSVHARQDQQLQEEVALQHENLTDKHYLQLQAAILPEIEGYKHQEQLNLQWLANISNVLQPLTGEPLTRTSAANLIGKVEQDYITLNAPEKQAKLVPTAIAKANVPAIELTEPKHSYNELLSYDKMKEFAVDYVRGKKV